MAKIIVVPKDKQAEYFLDYDKALPNHFVELILTEKQFDDLWNNGVFDLINKIASCIIDDYEDEHITNLTFIRLILDELRRYPFKLADFIKMFELALEYKTSIHFYF